MKEPVRKVKELIPRVRCKVYTCHYYKDGDYCLAEAITVESLDADTSDDTRCATFFPRAASPGANPKA
ncbi:MAG: DUF1540 domain-containing protein [Solirubrobacterales bacterium]